MDFNYSGNDILDIMKCAENYNSSLIKNVFESITKFKHKNILDFGCADGFFIEKIKNKFDNLNISGVEIDNFSLGECKKKKIPVYNDIKKIKAKFDLIYSFNVLEHIEDDVEVLSDFNSLLNDDGRIILYLPALAVLYSSMDKRTGHVRRYTKNDILKKIKKTGFTVEKVEYCDSLGVLITLLYILKDKIKGANGKFSKISMIIYDKIFPLSRLLDKLIFKNIIGKNLLIVAKK